MPEHHLRFIQPATACGFYVIGAKGSIEIQAKRIRKHSTQEQPQCAGWEYKVSQAALKGLPISAEQAVGNQKAASLWREHSRGKTTPYG